MSRSGTRPTPRVADRATHWKQRGGAAVRPRAPSVERGRRRRPTACAGSWSRASRKGSCSAATRRRRQPRPTLTDLYRGGARVIAVAARRRAGPDAPIDRRRRAASRASSGFLVFVDRPKADAGPSLARLGRLGIVVKIITGDSELVAVKVCQDIGLEVLGSLTGDQVDAMSDEELGAAIDATTVFARVGPDTKSRIVRVQRLARRRRRVPGRRRERRGRACTTPTSASRSTPGPTSPRTRPTSSCSTRISACLADGVVEGRRIFANTIKYILMGTSSNFGNMFSAAGGVGVPVVPADAAVADPAQQPALRRAAR